MIPFGNTVAGDCPSRSKKFGGRGLDPESPKNLAAFKGSRKLPAATIGIRTTESASRCVQDRKAEKPVR